jgi:hypothetical protein
LAFFLENLPGKLRFSALDLIAGNFVAGLAGIGHSGRFLAPGEVRNHD